MVFALTVVAGLIVTAGSSTAQNLREVGTYSLDNPAFSAFQGEEFITIDPGIGAVNHTSFVEAPEGTRLVVEHVSVRCRTPLGNDIIGAAVVTSERVSVSTTRFRSFFVPLHAQGDDGAGNTISVGALSSRLYSDRGGLPTSVRAFVHRSSGAGTSSCLFTVAGHRVALPPELVNAFPEPTAEKVESQELILPYAGALPPEALHPPEGTVVKVKGP